MCFSQILIINPQFSHITELLSDLDETADEIIIALYSYQILDLLYLNRQCIILLNGLGVPDESFISLQDKMLRSLALMLLFETVALETLQRANIPGGLKITALSRSGLNVTREPFFRSLLLAIYKSRLGDLLRRARIAIPETHGRLLMGVIDETGSLEYGQVFVRYSKLVSQPGKQLEILKGKVVISKNPCFHPGQYMTGS